jgi:hypothetical protein
LLRYGETRASPPVGPIQAQDRCGPEELALILPFQSKPDGEDDSCGRRSRPTGNSDIRAYGGIEQGVRAVILPVQLTDANGIAQADLSQGTLAAQATQRGYTRARLAQLASCATRASNPD